MYHARCYNTSDAQVAAWIQRISLWPSVILSDLCVALFGFHHRGHRGHRGRTRQQIVSALQEGVYLQPAATKAIPTIVKLGYNL
jgi:hypothetical protein